MTTTTEGGMTEQAMQIAISEACGWVCPDCKGIGTFDETSFANPATTIPRKCRHKYMPDYLRDLNACHEMEKVLTVYQRCEFLRQLKISERCYEDIWDAVNATAAQRCEAFLRTIGKWTE